MGASSTLTLPYEANACLLKRIITYRQTAHRILISMTENPKQLPCQQSSSLPCRQDRRHVPPSSTV